jgi:hypothetical protein
MFLKSNNVYVFFFPSSKKQKHCLLLERRERLKKEEKKLWEKAFIALYDRKYWKKFIMQNTIHIMNKQKNSRKRGGQKSSDF